jgi:serine/threonine protein kinase
MTTVKNRTITSVKTRKRKPNQLVFEKLPKCPGSRIRDMTSYKVKCGKDLLLGYKSIKSAEETSMYPNDFVHVIKSKLENYNDPVVVKIYDSENISLLREIKILERINGYRNTAILICHFSCKDNKKNYFSKIIKPMKPIRFCANGSHSLHYFVYEYIATGDISTFFTKNTDKKVIKTFALQLTAVIIELASIYKIYHGDINSGNIMIDTTEEKTLDYCIENETVTIETHGIIPKMIDYGKSGFYETDVIPIPIYLVWEDITKSLELLRRYIQYDKFDENILALFNNDTKKFSNLTECYQYVRDVILSE